ncbi:hypothetical protein PIB30_054444 [Stylosanthes scabra]|uniref:Uncharacterized protein n=1 Tax=Stylosanthes scabra TaxID=79078 RepID=A0ABU6SJG6_9FABA|nr:hypothetical protein [Stylosanthes scabra]
MGLDLCGLQFSCVPHSVPYFFVDNYARFHHNWTGEDSWEGFDECAVVGVFDFVDSEAGCKCVAIGSGSVAVEGGSNEWADCPTTLECNTAFCRVVSWCPQRNYELMPLYYPLVAGDIHSFGANCKSRFHNA